MRSFNRSLAIVALSAAAIVADAVAWIVGRSSDAEVARVEGVARAHATTSVEFTLMPAW